MSSTPSSPTVLLVGTCDTKLAELLYTRSQLLSSSAGTPSPAVLLLDIGHEPLDHPEIDIPHPKLGSEYHKHQHANESTDYTSLSRQSYTQAVTESTTRIISDLYNAHKIHAIFALGGSCGTSIATAAMRRALPIGFPKLMLSTMASGNIAPYVEETDIIMMYSVVDIAGTNSILTRILDNAAAAASAMAVSYFHHHQQQQQALNATNRNQPENNSPNPKRIGITMFGVTTPCVTEIQRLLAELPEPNEVYIFHATGSGGKAMERLVREHQLDAVIDLTTSEIVDELVGGVLSAGPHRLEAAASAGIPQVVSVGACDMINYGTRDTVPERLADRNIYEHNPTVTLVRTTPEENRKVGRFIVEKLRGARKPENIVVVLPTGGVSKLDVKGEAYWHPEADEVLFRTIEEGLDGSGVEVVRREEDVNHPGFAKVLVDTLRLVMEE
ncbi:Tm-1-like ATP-binding domain-containing protein [Aspergillus homomorphus CBS 101889]|uniref:UPF0261 domain protein n=1 Tax=Aspergillus homomorphus (strain CBS 101889) TaxID=1450537 RepID=A0A395HUR2_ASPHC|nr:UPF0261 domain protein [Aspergillus homomorphus CBS 101889]RAL11557.1 UPF0261 domain protein [Aspergillus homomorphus CBS 101889]